MKKEDKLFELVRSMTMSEKRYFKLFANRHTIGEQNNYILLFNEIEKLEVYSPEQLVKGLEKQGVPTRHISSDKNYLYNLILRSLSAFHSGKSTSLQVKEYLHQVEILYERGLFDHCIRILKKATSLAESHQLTSFLIEIEKWNVRVYEAQYEFGEQATAFERVNDAIIRLKNEQELLEILLALRAYEVKMALPRSQTNLDELRTILKESILKNPEGALSANAKVYYWQIYAKYHQLAGQDRKALEAVENALDIIRQQPKSLHENTALYASLHKEMLVWKWDFTDEEYYPLLFHFRSLPDQLQKAHPHIKANIFVDSYYLEMARLVKLQRFEDAFELIPSMESIYDTFEEGMTLYMKVTFYYLFAYVHLANQQYTRTLTYLNYILNDFHDGTRPELHVFTRILNLVTHYSLGNYKHLKYIVDSTQRYITRKNRMFRVERLILKLFRKLAHNPGKETKEKLLKQARIDLAGIQSNHLESRASLYFNFDGWLDHMLNAPVVLEDSTPASQA